MKVPGYAAHTEWNLGPGKKTRWRLKFAMFIEILDFMVNPPVVFNFKHMA